MFIVLRFIFNIAEILLIFADPPYVWVCIETSQSILEINGIRPTLCVGLYRNQKVAIERTSKYKDPPYVWVCIETIP